MKVLDLFCGCGGMSSGFEKAGFSIELGIDNWFDALQTFKLNHKNSKVLHSDLSKVDLGTLEKQYNFDIIIGGPPCQGFSLAGKRMIYDPRNYLYKSYVKFIKSFKPKVFVMENVPNIISMNNGEIGEQIINDFRNLKYDVYVEILNSANYGVPQNRKRAFFIGIQSELGLKYTFPNENKNNPIITSKDALSDLPENSVLDGTGYEVKPLTEYQKIIRVGSKGIFNHSITIHNPKTIEIISQVPDGGNYKDLPKHLQHTRKVNIAWTRMSSWKPCFTIDTGHNHHFHYEYNRVPTARESARIQSFGDKFIFLGNKGSQLKQIGNAVPPLLAFSIAKSIKKLF